LLKDLEERSRLELLAQRLNTVYNKKLEQI